MSQWDGASRSCDERYSYLNHLSKESRRRSDSLRGALPTNFLSQAAVARQRQEMGQGEKFSAVTTTSRHQDLTRTCAGQSVANARVLRRPRWPVRAGRAYTRPGSFSGGADGVKIASSARPAHMPIL